MSSASAEEMSKEASEAAASHHNYQQRHAKGIRNEVDTNLYPVH